MASSDNSLAGKRVLVTRTVEQAGSLVDLLRAQGAEVIVIPAIRIEPINPAPALSYYLGRLGNYQWLILTSANGVAALAAHMKDLHIPADAFAHMQCVAVGPATADAMRALGLRVDIVPEEYVAESVIAAIHHQVAGQNVLIIRGKLARDLIPQALTKAGACVDTADAYHTVIPTDSEEKVREVFLSTTPPEIVTFTSSSTVDNFIGLMDAAGLSERPAMLRAASIGPVTSAALRGYGWEPWVEAKLHTIPGLVEAMQNKRLSAGAKQWIARRMWILLPLLVVASIGGVLCLIALVRWLQR
jgi:uroporphyrinogen-III synthase